MYPVPLTQRYPLLAAELWSLRSVSVNHVLKVCNNILGQSLDGNDEEISDLLGYSFEELSVFNEHLVIHGRIVVLVVTVVVLEVPKVGGVLVYVIEFFYHLELG